MVKTSGDQCNIRPDVFIMYMFYGRKLPGSCNVRIQNKNKIKIQIYLGNTGCLEGWIRQV